MTPEATSDWPTLPTETEIYILPDGEVIVADLPAELAARLADLASPLRTESSPGSSLESLNSSHNADHVSNQ